MEYHLSTPIRLTFEVILRKTQLSNVSAESNSADKYDLSHLLVPPNPALPEKEEDVFSRD